MTELNDLRVELALVTTLDDEAARLPIEVAEEVIHVSAPVISRDSN